MARKKRIAFVKPRDAWKLTGLWLNSKVGYLFQSFFAVVGYHARRNRRYILAALGVLGLVLTLFGIVRFLQGMEMRESAKQYRVQALEADKDSYPVRMARKEKENKIAELSFGTDPKGAVVHERLSTLFKNMYSYRNGTNYDKHRVQMEDMFASKQVMDDVYSTNRDAGGGNMIDTLEVRSQLIDSEYYKDARGHYIAFVTYESAIGDISHADAKRRHSAVFDIVYKDDRIHEMKIIDTVKDKHYRDLAQ